MPKRNRTREAAKAARPAPPATKKRRAKYRKKTGPKSRPDPSDSPQSEVRYVMPCDATKIYLCPGCNRDIQPGTSHVVAVPPDVDLRRHWHRGCWDNRRSLPNR